MQVAEIANQRHGHGTVDLYWERAVKQLLRNAVDLLAIARGVVTLPELFEVIRTAPQDTDEARSATWQTESPCFQYIQQAAHNATENPDVQPEYALTAKYWLEEFPRMDNCPRSSIVSLFTTLADSFLRGKLRKLFSTETTVIPDHATLGRIIIVDLPVKEWSDLGQYAAVLMKFMTQKALERRPANDTRPVFICADEAHYFTTAYDQIFQTTARAARACTVCLTQNYSNYLSAQGGEAARPLGFGAARSAVAADANLGTGSTVSSTLEKRFEIVWFRKDVIIRPVIRQLGRRLVGISCGLNSPHPSMVN